VTEISHIGKITEASQIDKDIMDQLESMGFERETAISSILDARYNQLTATYHLLLLQKANADRAANTSNTSPEEESEGGVELDELGQPIGLPRIAPRARGRTMSTEDEVKELNPQSALLRKHMDLSIQAKQRLRPISMIVPSVAGVLAKEEGEDKVAEIIPISSISPIRTREASNPEILVGLSPNGTERPVHVLPPKKNPRPVLARMDSAKADLTTRVDALTHNVLLPPILPRAGASKVSSTHNSAGTLNSSLALESLTNTLSNYEHEANTTDVKADTEDCRTLRFAFSNATSTTHDADYVQQRINNVLLKEHIPFETVGYLTTATTEALTFELEVCKVPLIEGLHAVRMKRIQGDSWEYRDMHDRIVKGLEL